MSVDDAEPPEESPKLVGLSVRDGPLGATVAPNETVPENPLTLVKVTVDAADDPWTIEIDEGLAEIEKSLAALTVNETNVEWESEPLVPVTVIE